jgi:hypothetical protein
MPRDPTKGRKMIGMDAAYFVGESVILRLRGMRAALAAVPGRSFGTRYCCGAKDQRGENGSRRPPI